MIGRNAAANPLWVRAVAEQGHTAGLPARSPTPNLRRLSEQAGRSDTQRGFAAINAALAGKATCAPFFRYPGLRRVPPP
jgi:hypothetical protein